MDGSTTGVSHVPGKRYGGRSTSWMLVLAREMWMLPGGALCLYLHQERRARESDYICSFDMHSKGPLWFGPVRDHHSASFILPANFFARNYLPPSKRAHKRKLERRSAKECAKTCKPRYPSHSSRLSGSYYATPLYCYCCICHSYSPSLHCALLLLS
jgi:hypothetical protein